MIQDRNIDRDAQALRKVVTVPLIVPAAGVDQDEPLLILAPKYNWRLSDLYGSFQSLATADLIVKAQAVPVGVHAAGSPQLAPGTGVATFLIEEFWRRGEGTSGGSLINVAATAAQSFAAIPAGVATVLDGFWGVWLVQVNQSSDIELYAAAPIMAFATEAEALAHCPKVFDSGPSNVDGRVAILTVQAVGADFIAGTTNTDDALVAAFNTAPQDGHSMLMAVGTNAQAVGATLATALRDASRTKLLGSRGGGSTVVGAINGAPGDLLVVTVRSDGAPVITGGQVSVELRPSPAGGEGRGDASVSQTTPQFVP